MEGLIPLFYKAMKKNRIRSQYSVLSPEATAAAASQSYNIADFYVDPPSSHVFPNSNSFSTGDPRAGRTHRRFNSFGGSTAEDRWRSGGTAGKSGHGTPPPQQQQLVRFRSQRILSCLTGQSN